MSVENISPQKRNFLSSDLPTVMKGLSSGMTFHTDKHGDHLYQFVDKDNSRYKFAESMHSAMAQTTKISGWDNFVLGLYSLMSTAWYVGKLEEVYQKSLDGTKKDDSGDDLNGRIMDAFKNGGVRSSFDELYSTDSDYSPSSSRNSSIDGDREVSGAAVQDFEPVVPKPRDRIKKEGAIRRQEIFNRLERDPEMMQRFADSLNKSRDRCSLTEHKTIDAEGLLKIILESKTELKQADGSAPRLGEIMRDLDQDGMFYAPFNLTSKIADITGLERGQVVMAALLFPLSSF